MYKAVIFDLDGTLLNTIHDLANAGNHALTILGYQNRSISEFQSMVGDGIPKLVERMLPETERTSEVIEKALQLFLAHYKAHSEDETIPYDGILALLDTLKQSGYLLGVLTNKEDSLAQDVIEQIFPNTFHIVCGYLRGIPPKPDPTRLLEIAQRLNITTSDILYIGDSEVDMLTAKHANVTACGVLWGYRSKEQLLTIGAAHFIEEPAELMQYLQ